MYLVYFDRENAALLENKILGHGMTVTLATPSLDADVEQLGATAVDAAAVILDAEADAALARAEEFKARRGFRSVPLLFAGGTVADLTEAERRFPNASFCRLGSLITSLASLKG